MLLQLPDELVVHILGYCTLSSLRSLLLSCHKLYQLGTDDLVWKSLLHRYYDVEWQHGTNARSEFRNMFDSVGYLFNASELPLTLFCHNVFRDVVAGWGYTFGIALSGDLWLDNKLYWRAPAGDPVVMLCGFAVAVFMPAAEFLTVQRCTSILAVEGRCV